MHTMNRLQARVPSGAAAILFSMVLLLGFVLAGCDSIPTEAEDYVPEPVLTAMLQTAVPLDTVYLEWIGSFEGYYDLTELGISDADIVIFPTLDGDGAPFDTAANPEQVLRLVEDTGRPGEGHYLPVDPTWTPLGRWTYRIEVNKPADGVQLWAETTAPDTFSYYASFQNDPFTPIEIEGRHLTREDDEIFVNWSTSETARGYILGIVAETPRDSLVPLDPEFDPEVDTLEVSELDRHGWTFTRYDQNQMTIAWVFFQWAGWNRLYINAASESYYNYMFGMMMLEDPTWNVNPPSNVHGGLGVFGAYARREFNIYLERAEG